MRAARCTGAGARNEPQPSHGQHVNYDERGRWPRREKKVTAVVIHLPTPRPYTKAYPLHDPLPNLSLVTPSLRAAIAARLAVVVAITTALRPAALPFLLLL